MVDVTQFSAWAVVALFFIAIGVLVSHDAQRGEMLADRWERFAMWMSAHGRSEVDEDEEFARRELCEVLREERLRADLDRLRHLVATDTYMSATRQIGNRIAYRQLLLDCEAFASRPVLTPPNRAWSIEAADLQATRRPAGPESLDIRWR